MTSRPVHQPVALSRRAVLASAALAAAQTPHLGGFGASNAAPDSPATPASDAIAPATTVTVSATPTDALPFDRRAFGTVGVYNVDWLQQPPYLVLLDNLVASPGAFSGGRFFGALSAGGLGQLTPESTGAIWPSTDAPIDFTPTFNALAELTSRGLTPFVGLGFFPGAVSSGPIQPPADWSAWKMLVRIFLEHLVADARFGAERIADWWFEVWNEPNEPGFFAGTRDQYFALYRATSDAVRESGVTIRLGGPVIAYQPQANPDDGAPWIERFLRFIASDPSLQLDFVSLHRKGTVADDPPDPRRLYDAAAATADQMLTIDPERFRGLTIINDEADEKVGFEVPYQPRLDQHNAAWLAATTALHVSLAARYREDGLRFVAAADNADVHLVQAPFDGRRSIMTRATSSPTDLLKIAPYGFYELLRLHGDRVCEPASGPDGQFPADGIFRLATVGDGRVTAMLTHYPEPTADQMSPRPVALEMRDIPWDHVNIARFLIDRDHSNSWTAAGGSASNPFPVPSPEAIPGIRQAQEVALAEPIARDVAIVDSVWRTTLTLAPFATTEVWITPVDAAVPATPWWTGIEQRDGNVILRWSPSDEPSLYGYEVWLMGSGAPVERLTPDPLRAALWVDTARPAGSVTYGVRAVSVSGVASPFAISQPFPVPVAASPE